MYSFPNFEPVHFSMSGYNSCFLTCIEVSQKTDKVVWYSHLFMSFPQFVVIHTVKGFHIVSEAVVRTGHGTTKWFQIGKGYILSPCLFNFSAEYIM